MIRKILVLVCALLGLSGGAFTNPDAWYTAERKCANQGGLWVSFEEIRQYGTWTVFRSRCSH